MKKEDFIVGNWYKSQYNNYFKFLKFENDDFYSSEEIINNKWLAVGRRAARGFRWVGMFEEINISEITYLLPQNHPDLLNVKSEIKTDFNYLNKFLKELNIKDQYKELSESDIEQIIDEIDNYKPTGIISGNFSADKLYKLVFYNLEKTTNVLFSEFNNHVCSAFSKICLYLSLLKYEILAIEKKTSIYNLKYCWYN